MDPLCRHECAAREKAEHLILECKEYDNQRTTLKTFSRSRNLTCNLVTIAGMESNLDLQTQADLMMTMMMISGVTVGCSNLTWET